MEELQVRIFEATLPVSVEQYKESDKEAIITGIVDLQEYERAISDTRRPGIEIAEQYLHDLLETINEKRGALFVARSGGRIIGFVSCWVEHEDNPIETPESNTFGYISDAYTIPEARGKGVFQRLSRQADEYLSQFPEVTLIRINVLAENEQAIESYRQAGYKPEEVKMVKRIKDHSQS